MFDDCSPNCRKAAAGALQKFIAADNKEVTAMYNRHYAVIVKGPRRP